MLNSLPARKGLKVTEKYALEIKLNIRFLLHSLSDTSLSKLSILKSTPTKTFNKNPNCIVRMGSDGPTLWYFRCRGGAGVRPFQL